MFLVHCCVVARALLGCLLYTVSSLDATIDASQQLEIVYKKKRLLQIYLSFL